MLTLTSSGLQPDHGAGTEALANSSPRGQTPPRIAGEEVPGLEQWAKPNDRKTMLRTVQKTQSASGSIFERESER